MKIMDNQIKKIKFRRQYGKVDKIFNTQKGNVLYKEEKLKKNKIQDRN